MDRAQSIAMRDFLVDFHFRPGGELVAEAATRFEIEPASVRYHIRKLCKLGYLAAEGNTKARRYTIPLEHLVDVEVDVEGIEDDYFWGKHLKPVLERLGSTERVAAICSYGSTEMLNNVIDHSGSKRCRFTISRDALSLTLGIHDYGIGIFEKIRGDCDLVDRRQALLELSKGKLTSDPTRHSGEGIFFTSRAFDRFAILSLDLTFYRRRDGENWLWQSKANETDTEGTQVLMEVKHDTDVVLSDVFRRFEDDDSRFMKTHVPVELAKLGEHELVSRSQAKRLMARVENFSEVVLDFADVRAIGQAFADEIFRVWTTSHPETTIVEWNVGPDVARMIAHARANGA